MKNRTLTGFAAFALMAMVVGINDPAHATNADTPKAGGALASYWTVPKEDGKVILVIAGQPDPVTTSVSDTTIFGGICLDCSLPLEFKTGETSKKCLVCGCVVSNAACIVGKPVKEGTWQAMLKALPHGVGIHPTFNTADKPESGLKKLVVDLRLVLMPVAGLDSQTPDQLLALVKPLGGTQAELIDGGKRLSVHLKSDWTTEKEGKFEKSLAKINAKVVAPDAAN